MREHLLARLCTGLGLLATGLIGFFGAGWAEAGGVERAAFVAAVLVAAVGIGLGVKHRRQRTTTGA